MREREPIWGSGAKSPEADDVFVSETLIFDYMLPFNVAQL